MNSLHSLCYSPCLLKQFTKAKTSITKALSKSPRYDLLTPRILPKPSYSLFGYQRSAFHFYKITPLTSNLRSEFSTP